MAVIANALKPSREAELLELRRANPAARFENALRSLMAHRLNREEWLPEEMQSPAVTVGDTVAGMVPAYGIAHGIDTGNPIEIGLNAIPLGALARSPAVNALVDAVVPRVNSGYVNATRRFNAPTVGIEATSPELLQEVKYRYDGTPAHDRAGMDLGDARFDQARQAAGGPYANTPVTQRQGAWYDEDLDRYEYNPLYTQRLPARPDSLGDDLELGRYLGQMGRNLDQKVVGAVRFNRHLAGRNPRGANALRIGHDEPLSDADIIALGKAVKSDGFVAHQPDGRAVIVPFGDPDVMMGDLAERARGAAPGARITYGRSDDGRDRIAYPYLERLEAVNALLADKPQALQRLEAQIRARKR